MQDILRALLSSDNQTRNNAETALTHCIDNNFKLTLHSILQLTCHANQDIALMASIMLKNKLLGAKQSTTITAQEYSSIIDTINKTLIPQLRLAYLKKQVQSLVTALTRSQRSSEILNYINAMIGQTSRNSIILALYIIEISCQYAFNDELLLHYSRPLSEIIIKMMNNQDVQIQAAAIKTLLSYIESVQQKKTLECFTDAIPLVLKKIVYIVQVDQSLGQDVIAQLTGLLEKHTSLIKVNLTDTLTVLTEIASNISKIFGPRIRIVALDGIRNIVHKQPKLVKSNEYFVKNTLGCYFDIIAQSSKIPLSQWVKDLNNQELQRVDVSAAAVENLCQLHQELGSQFLMPLFINQVSSNINSQKNNEQHAALSIMYALAPGCAQSFKSDMHNIFRMVFLLADSPDPRIQYDVMVVISLLCAQFAPQLQQQHGFTILQFCILMINSKYHKLQRCGIECMSNFCTDIKQNEKVIGMITQHLDQMMKAISIVFDLSVKHNVFELIEECICCLTALSDVCTNKFSQYYDFFMPGLRKYFDILSQQSNKQLNIRIKLIECMGYMLASIREDKPEIFVKDCREIMMSLFRMLEHLDQDDPFRVGFFAFSENIIVSLKQSFEQYLPTVFKHVINGVNIAVQAKLVDNDAPILNHIDTVKKYTNTAIDLKMMGGVKQFVFHSSAMEIKMQASKLLVSMGQHLKILMENYIPTCIQTICQNINFKNSWCIRMCMIQAIKYLIECCSNQKQKAFFAKVTFDPLIGRANSAIKQKRAQEINEVMETIAQTCQYYSPQMIQCLPLLIQTTVKTISKMSQEQSQSDDQSVDVEDGLRFIKKMILKLDGAGHKQFHKLLEFLPSDVQ